MWLSLSDQLDFFTWTMYSVNPKNVNDLDHQGRFKHGHNGLDDLVHIRTRESQSLFFYISC